MIVTREVISALGRAIVGDVDDFEVDKDLKFLPVNKSYNDINFTLYCPAFIYIGRYIPNSLCIEELASLSVEQLSEDDLHQLIIFINKQKSLHGIKERKRFEDDLKKFRDVIYECETTGG